MLSTLALTLLAQADDGSPGYVVGAVVTVGIFVLAFLAIVAVRVRGAAVRLEQLERRLDRAAAIAPEATVDEPEVAR